MKGLKTRGIGSEEMDEQELAAADFFGYTSHKFCGEVHAICYNEYLSCVCSTRERLQTMYPERKEEIQEGCTNLLVAFSRHLDENAEYFLQYYEKNIHSIPCGVPLYGVEIEESREAGEKLNNLKQRIVAVNQLNHTILERVTKMEEEVLLLTMRVTVLSHTFGESLLEELRSAAQTTAVRKEKKRSGASRGELLGEKVLMNTEEWVSLSRSE